MLGFDFSVFWETGRAVLQGVNPYAAHMANYPPAAVYMFAIFGLLPFAPSFAIWTGMNFVFLYDILRRRGLLRQIPAWLAFTPTFFVLQSGQSDLLFFWLSVFLNENGWKAVLAAALITLKPQVALILLPWHLVRWLLHERKKLLAWVGVSLVLHLTPLLFDRLIYWHWFLQVKDSPGWRMQQSSGVWLLTNFSSSVLLAAVLGAAALAVSIWGLTRDEVTARAALLMAQPVGIWYEDVFLVGAVSWKLALPLSWAAFGLAVLFQNGAPMILLAGGVLAWRAFQLDRFFTTRK